MSAVSQGTGSASIAGQAVEFRPQHRDDNTSPVAFVVTVAMPVSLEDLVAAAWSLLSAGATVDEIAINVHTLLVDEVANSNGDVRDARYAIRKVRPGTDAAALLAQLRELIGRVYGPAVAPVEGLRPASIPCAASELPVAVAS